ncbi:hypothetical protein [Streptomyces sp. NPDC059009]|uniref:hypothetical protein n=1 Tax=Streptomyces sp. NPDC059009 TaxID=3346694 RepID=UPI0036A9C754
MSSDTGESGRQGRGQGRHQDVLPLLAGVAVAVGAVGAMLALTDITSPLRAPFVLFFLLAAPGAAIGACLEGLDPWGRAVAAVSGAVAVDLLTAQALLALHTWSVRGGVVIVGLLSALIHLLTLMRRLRRRTARRRTS